MREAEIRHFHLFAGHYGVVQWEASSSAVTALTGHDNGYGSVADPRVDALPEAQAIASVMGKTFSLGNTPIRMRPVAVALAVRENGHA